MGSNLLMLAELIVKTVELPYCLTALHKGFIKTGQLVKVLPEWTAPHGIFHAVYPSRRGLLPPVRFFIDYLVEQHQNSTINRPD